MEIDIEEDREKFIASNMANDLIVAALNKSRKEKEEDDKYRQ